MDEQKHQSQKSIFPWFIEEFFNYKDFTERTKDIYKTDFIFFFNWLSNQNLCNHDLSYITLEELDKLTLKEIKLYKKYLETYKDVSKKNKSFSQTTIARKLSVLSSLFHYLANVAVFSNDNPYLQNNWFYFIKKNDNRKSPHIKAKYLTDEILITLDELYEFRDFVSNEYHNTLDSDRQLIYYNKNRLRDTAIISLFLFSGIRLNELVNLELDDLYLHKRFLIIKSENGIERKITLFEDAVKDLENYLYTRKQLNSPFSNVFLSKYNNEYSKMSVRAIQVLITKYSKSFYKTDLSAQKLRHSFSTVLFASTNNIFELQRELGQETVNPVLVYTKLYNKKDNKLC
ncbi:tyrosine-type recombinase/integrase [Cytobacillus solani]|uniref:tyrosine-type recombinase/integrase n=1 Tax=Cytobacillus solani TaxID=1637975 RepID=UPI00207A07CD|nr:tyrosine-type recombinase/integrase [Cytobacillus solani]USK57382.1 tyrosine-type recombinase/integrase [Cytobacillus solani]